MRIDGKKIQLQTFNIASLTMKPTTVTLHIFHAHHIQTHHIYTTKTDEDERKALNYDPPNNDANDYSAIRTSAEAILKLRNNQKTLSPDNINHLQSLWDNNVIQSIFAIRNEICVPDSTAYFFNDFGRITAAEYVPNDTDLLMVRYRTTGTK